MLGKQEARLMQCPNCGHIMDPQKILHPYESPLHSEEDRKKVTCLKCERFVIPVIIENAADEAAA